MQKSEIITKSRQNCINISVFGYKNTEQFPAYVTKNAFKKHVCSVLIEKEDQSYYVLFEDFNMFLFNQTLHRDRKHFCC